MVNHVETENRMDQFRILPGKDANGESLFSVLVKRTYDIVTGQPCRRADRDLPFVETDQYYDSGDPEWATVQYESDLVPFKQATDVVLIAKAHAPQAKPVTHLDVAVEIENLRKVIRVIGKRECRHRKDKPPLFTDPQPFTQMEIRYEKAYGGWDRKSMPDMPFAYPRNPQGTGMVLKNIPAAVEGLVLPNLEDPNDLMTPERVVLQDPNQWNAAPLPQGLGWFHKSWYPRCSFAGSVPAFTRPGQVLREEGLGLVPADQVALARQFKLPGFDTRFNNGASPGLVRPYLRGGEIIRLTHLVADTEQLSFQVPVEKPAVMMDIGLGQNQIIPQLFTVCIRPEQLQVDLVWGAAHIYPGVDWLPEMKTMHAEVTAA
jgi:hypothetical protein